MEYVELLSRLVLYQWELLLLAVLSFLGAKSAYPYELDIYNVQCMPKCLRPSNDYIDTLSPLYYPARESRLLLSGIFLALVVVSYLSVILPEKYVHIAFPLLISALAPAYMLHRLFCFHKLNKMTPACVIEQDNPVVRYAVWKIWTVWIMAMGCPVVAAIGWIPVEYSVAIIFMLYVLSLCFILWELKADTATDCDKYIFGNVLKDFVPYGFYKCYPFSYYILLWGISLFLFIVSVYTFSLLWAMLWIIIMMIFNTAEYYFRFHDRGCINNDMLYECWGEDRTKSRFSHQQETEKAYDLAFGKRKNYAAKWVALVKCVMTGKLRVSVVVNLTGMQRYSFLTGNEVLYLKKCINMEDAYDYGRFLIRNPDKWDEYIRNQNPEYNNLMERLIEDWE